MDIVAQKISKRSLFKILFIGLTIGMSLLCVVFGIAALFGAQTVQWFGDHKTGIEGLLYSLIMGPIFGFVFTSIIWFFTVIGLGIYSFINPLKVSFKNPIE